MIHGRTARIAVTAALLALCALTIDGIFRHGLLKLQLWEPAGLRSLAWFSGVGMAVFGSLALLIPRYMPAAVIAAAAVYTVIAVGPIAPGAVLLMLWSAHSIGALWLPRKGPLDTLLCAATGAAVLIALMNATAHAPVNYPLVWLGLLAVPILLARRIPLPSLRADLTRPEALSIGALLFLALIPCLLALKPEVSADGLAMHLVIPWTIAREHAWHFDVTRFAWSVMPMGGDWLYTIAVLLGGEFAARLWNVATLLLTCGFVFSISRLWLPLSSSALIVAVLLSNPLTGLVSTSLFVENIWALLITAAFVAVWRFHESRGNRFLYAAALLTGAALATKVGSFAFAGIAAAIIGIERPRAKPAAAAAAIFLAAGSAPYLSAWAHTGNPIFPFANQIFKSPLFDSAAPFVDVRFQKPLTPFSLYDYTFGTSAYFEAQNGAWGFHMLWLIPVTLLLVRRQWSWLPRVSLAAFLIYSTIALASTSNLRYIYPAMPLLLIAAAQGIGAIPTAALRHGIAATVALFLPLNIYFFAAANWYHREFVIDAAFHKDAVQAYEQAMAPSRALVRHLNEKRPGEPAAFLEVRQVGELQAQAYPNVWHSYAFDRALKQARDARDIIRVLNDRAIRYAIAPSDLRSAGFANPAVPFVLARFAEVEQSSGDIALYRLADSFAGPAGWRNVDEATETRAWLAEREEQWRATLADSGHSYDDTAHEILLRGSWFTDRQFLDALQSTVTYSSAPGDTAAIRFHGTGATYIHTKAANRGIAEIIVDGVMWGEVDCYSAATLWRAPFEISGLSPADHTLEIRVSGRRNPRSRGTFVDLDAIEVRSLSSN